MKTPVTIYTLPEKDRKRVFYLFLGALCAGLIWQIVFSYFHLYFLSSLGFGLPVIFSYALNSKVEITRFGVFRTDNVLQSSSLKWNEISDLTVDREHQQITVTGTPPKKAAIQIVIRCPNGELDEVLSLLTEQLPHTTGAKQETSHLTPAGSKK